MVAEAGLEPATFGLCLPLQLSLLSFKKKEICSLDFPFIPSFGGRMSAIKSLHLLFEKNRKAWLGITIPKASPNLTDFIPELLPGQPLATLQETESMS